jgi:phosphatidylinositol alpha-mannosyltransferase
MGSSTEVNTPFHTKADINIARDIEAIDRLFAEEKFDILHVHEPGIPLLAAQLLSRSTAKNVATMHASLPEGMISKSFEKLMKPFAKYIEPKLHLVSAVSEVAKNISLGYAPNLDITVIPNGIRLSDYAHLGPSARKNKRQTVLYIGRLERRKGVTYLLDAFAGLQAEHPNTELIIAGDGRHHARLEQKAEKLNLKHVRFLGFVSETKKKQLLADADIYCSPAIYGESFGIVLLEAMAAGCVTIAGNNPGYASVMTDRGRISLVNPQDSSSFTERLELLLYDQAMRDLWLNWAKEHVQQYDFNQVVTQYEALYQRALQLA